MRCGIHISGVIHCIRDNDGYDRNEERKCPTEHNEIWVNLPGR